MPRGPKINFLNHLTPQAIIKLTVLSRDFSIDEGIVLTRLVEWAAGQDHGVQAAIIESDKPRLANALLSSLSANGVVNC